MNDAIAFPTDDPGPRSLAELEARLARDIDFLALSWPALIVRDWHALLEYRVTREGRCAACATPVAGRFEEYHGQ